MRVFKWIVLALVWSAIALFLHYQLPRTDVVRIVGTEVTRVDVGGWPMFWSEPGTSVVAGAGAPANRDVFVIQTIEADGGQRVFRNEDTGFWPPYLKFDSGDLQAEAADLTSTREAPQWVAVRYYGWRLPMLTVYPNAVSIRPVAGPDVLVIPWVTIVVLLLLAVLFAAAYLRWRRFREARIDPRLDAYQASWEERRRRRAEARRLRRERRLGE